MTIDKTQHPFAFELDARALALTLTKEEIAALRSLPFRDQSGVSGPGPVFDGLFLKGLAGLFLKGLAEAHRDCDGFGGPRKMLLPTLLGAAVLAEWDRNHALDVEPDAPALSQATHPLDALRAYVDARTAEETAQCNQSTQLTARYFHQARAARDCLRLAEKAFSAIERELVEAKDVATGELERAKHYEREAFEAKASEPTRAELLADRALLRAWGDKLHKYEAWSLRGANETHGDWSNRLDGAIADEEAHAEVVKARALALRELDEQARPEPMSDERYEAGLHAPPGHPALARSLREGAMKVVFTGEEFDTELDVLFEAQLECVPEIGHYVMSPTTSVHQVVGVIHLLEQGGVAHQIFCMTRLVRAAP